MPDEVLTNDDLAKMVDTSDEWIRTRTGIGARHRAADGEQNSDMATAAARRALEMAGKRAEDLDMIVLGTISGDMPMPACAALVQAKLGASCPSFDVSAACAGSMYGLSIADQFIRTGAADHVLVIGSELLTRLVDWNDRNTCVLFGDAAGAMVVGPEDRSDRGILTSSLHTDGRQADILKIPGGGTQHRLDVAALESGVQHIKMNGREVFKVAVRSLVETIRQSLERVGLTADDVDHVIPHQANVRIIDSVLQKLQIPSERAFLNIERYGNTSSASLPITLDEAVRAGRISDGDIVAMMAIGAGMSWGSAVLRW